MKLGLSAACIVLMLQTHQPHQSVTNRRAPSCTNQEAPQTSHACHWLIQALYQQMPQTHVYAKQISRHESEYETVAHINIKQRQ